MLTNKIFHGEMTRNHIFDRPAFNEFHRLTNDPTINQILSINLIDRKDCYWRQYLADHNLKYACYSLNILGYSNHLLM